MTAKEIGASLRRARLQAWPETNLDEASGRLGISRPYLSSLETGAKYPSFDLLLTMAEQYGCAVGDLLPCTQLRSVEMEPLAAALANLPLAYRKQVIAQAAGLVRSIAAGFGQLPVFPVNQQLTNSETISDSAPYNEDTLSFPINGGGSSYGRKEETNSSSSPASQGAVRTNGEKSE